MKREHGMTIIVKTITRFTVWLIMLYGIFLVVHGHLTPGGGFAGGLVIALAFIHITLAYGKDSPVKLPDEETLHMLESTGVLFYVGVGLVAMLFGLPFLTNFLGKGTLFDLFSSGTIPLLNFAVALKVGTGIFLAFVVLALVEHDEGEDNREE